MFDMPKYESPIIKVIGVGGGGSNAVNNMFKQGIVGVDFAICNTDSQAMEVSPITTKLQLGPNLTEGRGAGSKPDVGKEACLESLDDVNKYLENDCKMLFITAGMGGGTGTGAAPVIAKVAKEMGILTVGIVTTPFIFEGRKRTAFGKDGLEELKKYVDTLIVVSNDKLRQIYGNLSISEAFAKADNILTTAAKGIAEIITVPGYVNVDFEDVNTVMRESGVAIMGTSIAEGEDRAKKAVDEALNSPLLEDNSIKGAENILLNITSGKKEVTMDEIFEITEFVQEEAGFGTNLIWGNCHDTSLEDSICVTVIATGFENKNNVHKEETQNRVVVSLDDEKTNEKPNGLAGVGFQSSNVSGERTIEFDDVREDLRRFNNNQMYSYDEPYVKNDPELTEDEQARQTYLESERKRREALRTQQFKLNNPKAINELESQPAYKRRGVQLENTPKSNQPTMSKWALKEEDGKDEIDSNGNAYLHDNVD